MTHSLHRQGTRQNLTDDFIVLTASGRKFTDTAARIKRFREIGFNNGAVNVPGVQSIAAPRHLVFDNMEKLCAFLNELKNASLEMSVVVTGLRDRTAGCCHADGLAPHTINQSFGFWGRTEKLPPPPVLEITTMCGHSRVAPNLVWDMADRIQNRTLDANTAARSMGKLCLCNIFNEVRAAKLLNGLVSNISAGSIVKAPSSLKAPSIARKDFGITIDETKCILCMECLPYCPFGAIVESADSNTVAIDAARCTECGLCRQARVCPVDAIIGMDLTWPRSLRGRFQHSYGPYRSAPSLMKTALPVGYNAGIFMSRTHGFPSEHTNDVSGLLKQGEAVINVEMGRPHTGTEFRDVQKMIKALLPFGLKLSEQFPSSDERSSLADVAVKINSGDLMPEILGEKAGWVVLRLVVPENRVPETVQCLKQVAADIDTVFVLGIVSRVGRDGSTIAERVALGSGIIPAVNCKTNVGLGRPLSQD